MSDFALAQAADADAPTLVQDCIRQLSGADGHTLGFVYATDPLAAAMGDIVTALKNGTGISDWVGTVGHGICATGTEMFGQPAIAVLTCRFDKQTYRLLETLDGPDAAAAGAEPGFAAGLGIVHGDPRNAKTIDIVSSLAHAHGVYLVGGLTSAQSAFPQVAGAVTDGGVSGVLLGGRLEIAMGLTQGCAPIGPSHAVTLADGQVLATLDERPAFEVLREDLGVADDADATPWLQNIHAALPVEGSESNDYLVRNLVGIEPTQGLVVIAEEVMIGDRVLFVRRDEESAGEDLKRMLADMAARISKPPRAGLYYSCVARGPNLFDGEAHEMGAIAQAFGDIPIAGFFGNGEIADDRVYGYTGVLTLFL